MNRARSALLVLATLVVTGGAVRADSAASKNNEGNRLYDQKRLDEALKMYTDAQVSRPDASELHYNIGNVLYRKGEFDKALEEYLRAQAAKDPHLAQAATYNRGNALLRMGKLQDAVNAYVQALRARPDDQEAKRNLELALRLMKEQEKKPQQDSSSQSKQDPSKSGEQPPHPQGQGDQKKPPPQRSQGQMSEEEAKQILDSLRDEEKEGIKKHAQAMAGDRRPPEEDW